LYQKDREESILMGKTSWAFALAGIEVVIARAASQFPFSTASRGTGNCFVATLLAWNGSYV